jgi:REP element-mobilizing transposase RayT
MAKRVPDQVGRRSIRLKGYDYSQAGGYYVTVVTIRRECRFGNVAGGEMHLNVLGKIVQEEWFRSARIRKEIRLFEDEFVVMPNHIHGIVWIDPDTVGADGVRPNVEGVRPNLAGGVRPENYAGANHAGACQAGACHAPLQRRPRSLGSFVAGFKASVTGRAGRELNSGDIWQRNYFEHILRDQADYERIAGYILENPVNWDKDVENPRKSAGDAAAYRGGG